MIKSLCILGGGNAGLMAALYLKAGLPHLTITVICSSKIGTVGVGEGSTEHWKLFADAVGISNAEIVKEAGATLKGGIKFENWHGDGTSYFHSIPKYMGVMDSYSGLPYTMLGLIADGTSTEELYWKLSMDGFHTEPLAENFYQFHFDSEKLNSFFKRKCKEREINIIDAEIVDVSIGADGFVEALIDYNNTNYYADFFIDSSGFKRLISSKLGSKWVDWSKYLPMNSAIAFPSPYEEKIPPYTLAKALSSGWHWRSPVQDRFGNGYVYSDAFINDQDALNEIQQEFNHEIQVAKKVNFISGKVDQFWIKNCVCVGLSSSFVEPLEASSISTTVQQVRVLAGALVNWNRNDTVTIKEYNKIFDEVMTNILDFIQLHYFTERNDTKFWQWCKDELTLTDFNKEHLELFKTNFINQLALSTNNYNIYDLLNWTQVMHGLRMFDIPKIKNLYETTLLHTREISKYELATLPTLETATFYTSREAVNIIKSRSLLESYNL